MLAPAGVALPGGVYPRQMLMHLAIRAVRSRGRHLSLGRTVNEFLQEMGIRNSGGKRGSSNAARDQISRLCQTTFTYRRWRGREGASVSVLDRWAAVSPDRLPITLGERFFKLASEHAVPLDRAVVRNLRRSSLALDMYAWLTYRSATLKKETLVPWAKLAGQIGADCRHQRQFRWRFKRALDAIRGEWPNLRNGRGEGGPYPTARNRGFLGALKGRETRAQCRAKPSAASMRLREILAEVMTEGYALVSTVDQDPEHQVRALEESGCERIFTDHCSGRTRRRPQLDAALDFLREGDLVSLTETLGTAMLGGRVVSQVCAALVAFGADVNSERSREAYKAAKARRRPWGRRSIFHDPATVRAAKALLRDPDVSKREAARQLGVSAAMLRRWFPGKVYGKGL